MAKYPLTERQKNFLRSLPAEFENGTVDAEWVIIYGGEGILGIHGLNDATGELWRNVWEGIKFSDFQAFVKCGLFDVTGTDKYGQNVRYSLNEHLIIEAVANDFEVNDWLKQPGSITVSGDFRGSNVNVASVLQNATQSINNSRSVGNDQKAELEQLLNELNQELQGIPDSYSEEAEVIAYSAQAAVQQVASPKPNKRLIKVNVDELERAAQVVGKVAPPVITLGYQIAKLIQSML